MPADLVPGRGEPAQVGAGHVVRRADGASDDEEGGADPVRPHHLGGPHLVGCAIVESKRHDRAVPRRLRTAWMGPGRGGQQEGCRKSEGSQAPGVADPWPQWRPCPHPHGPPYVAEFPPSTRH